MRVPNSHLHRYIAIILQILSLSSSELVFQLDTFDKPRRTCEPIIVDICKGELAYNNTGNPSFLDQGSYTQQQSVMTLEGFRTLVMTGCSQQLKPFLCTAFVPMCDPQVEQLIGPCRSVCENVKVRINSVLYFIYNYQV